MSERNVGRIKTGLREETQTRTGGEVARSESMSRSERTTMVVRLHPGQHQKISATSQQVRGTPVCTSHNVVISALQLQCQVGGKYSS